MGMSGFNLGASRTNVADLYRHGCTPLADDASAQRDDSHHAIWGLLLPFVGVFGTVAVIVGLMIRTVDAEQYTPSALRWVFGGGASLALVCAVWLWKRVWVIDDMPTIEVAAAHPGTCEFVGKARTDYPATAWFSGLPVIWWEASITEWQKKADGGRELKTIWEEKGGHKKFWVDDGTGLLAVNSTGAATSGARITVDRTINNIRIVERALVADERVFLTGPVQLQPNGELEMRRARNQLEAGVGAPFWIARSEARLRSTWRGGAMFFTTLAILLAAATSIWTVVPSTDPLHLDKNTLMIKESPILIPFLVVLAGGVGLQLLHYGLRLYNRLIALKQQAAFAWATIDVAVARRHSLISRLTGVALASANHERETLEEAIRTRSQLPSKEKVRSVTTEFVTDGPGRTRVGTKEAHPDLEAAAAFDDLFANLVDTENRIAASRRFYNDAVVLLTDRAKAVPGIFVAPLVLRGRGIPPLLRFGEPLEGTENDHLLPGTAGASNVTFGTEAA